MFNYLSNMFGQICRATEEKSYWRLGAAPLVRCDERICRVYNPLTIKEACDLWKICHELVAVAGMCGQDADFSDTVRLKIAVSDRVVVVSEADVVEAVASFALRSFSDCSRPSRVTDDVITCSPKGRNQSMMPVEERWSSAVDLLRPKKGNSNQASFVVQQINRIMFSRNEYINVINFVNDSAIDEFRDIFGADPFGVGHFPDGIAAFARNFSNQIDIIDQKYLNQAKSENINSGKFLC
ncbi:hypothetical protein [Methylobacterium radiotolerans]|uniref:hypothetical protein n=1 Tax=Methylobacterium radiotolerans TaxID=31998 RepID=UPI001588B332|nr:hypothetical protein [Methylobacterium radiotolerans]MBY0252193.1 hypothetical protein [Methylobacterium organophilum]